MLSAFLKQALDWLNQREFSGEILLCAIQIIMPGITNIPEGAIKMMLDSRSKSLVCIVQFLPLVGQYS